LTNHVFATLIIRHQFLVWLSKTIERKTAKNSVVLVVMVTLQLLQQSINDAGVLSPANKGGIRQAIGFHMRQMNAIDDDGDHC